jgi:hypothetical protein
MYFVRRKEPIGRIDFTIGGKNECLDVQIGVADVKQSAEITTTTGTRIVSVCVHVQQPGAA